MYETLTERTGAFYWARKQETDQRLVDRGGRVLLIGDAAGAIYPSLGQGATLAIEDACAAAAVLRAFARAAVEAGAPRVDVRAATRAIDALRRPRREEVRETSRRHALHVHAADGAAAALAAEVADWTGARGGGTFPEGEWRRRLAALWGGWPRPEEADQAVSAAARAAARATVEQRSLGKPAPPERDCGHL